MKIAQLASLLPLLFLAAALPARAGGDDTSFYHHESTTVSVQKKSHNPFVYIGRGVDTLLSWPRVLAEGLQGDRVLVNHRGIFATREIPVEERIISPED